MDAGRQSDFTQSLDLGLSLSGPWAVRRRSHILESFRALEANNGKPAPQDPAPLAASPAPAPQGGAASPPPPPILASAGGETQAGAAPPAVPPAAVALPRASGSAIAAVGETTPVVPVPPEEKQPYAPDTVIVTLRKADASLAKELAQLRADAGVQSYRALSNIPIEIWTLAKGSNVLDVVAKHASSPLLESIEPDYLVSLNAIPNDPSFNQLWGLHNTGQNGGVVDADIDAPEAWNLQTGNPNLVIGVLDTGVDYTHQDLAGNIWINPGEIANDGIDNDGNGYVDDIRGWDFAYNDNDPMDVHSHGTHVAGTIAARGNNSLGVTGVAWNAKIMPLKFLNDSGSGFVSNAVLALNYALNKGVRITNNSWGGGPYSASLYAAISAANTAGSLFVAAAGNFGLNADTNPMYPAAYNLANIISVASTTRTDTRSSFSNYGLTSVDLGAPGSDIYSTIPGDGYGWKSGTSMAAPHVAGGAALLWSHNPTLTSQQVKATLMNTGDPLPSLAGVTVSGKRLNLNNALASLPLSVVTVVATDASAAETPTGAPPNPGQFTLNRTVPTTGSLTVNVSLSGTASNGVDYTTISTPITFGPGITAVTVPLTVIDDLLVEGTETAILTIVPGVGYTVGAASTATVTIADNERPIVTVTASDASAAETLSGSPANPGQFTLSRTGVPTGTLTVAVSLTGTASNGVDYTTISTPITFGPGITAVTVPLTVIDDLLIEGTETAVLTIVPGASYTVGAASTATVTIADNERPIVTVTASDASAAETPSGSPANPGQFTLSRTGVPTGTLSVAVSLTGTATNGVDYTTISTPITFGPGITAVTVPLTVIDDLLIEGTETAILTIVPGTGYTVGAASSATVTIADNERPIVTVTASDASAAETLSGSPANPGQFTLSRTGVATGTLSVAVSLTGTATNGVDYTTISTPITFGPGITAVTVPLTVIDDLLIEGTETAILTIVPGASYTVGAASTATVTIADNERPIVTVTASDASAAETPSGSPANPGQFTLSRTGVPTGTISVAVSLTGTASNGVDYTAISTPITFGPGITAVTVPLTVIDDLLIEGTETAVLTIVPGASYTVGAASTATVTIADNERPIVTVTASDASAAETLSGSPANPGQFTLIRTGVPTGTLTVAVSLTGTASNGVDYTTISTPITFGPGVTAVTVPVTVIDDLLIEGTETAILTIVPGASYTVGAASSAAVQIIDNDFVSSTIILNPFDRGWYDNSGFHNPSNPNYIVGDSFSAYRNFFAFNLPVFSAPILSAQLALNTYDYNSAAASENYVLQEVTTPVSTLVAGGTGQTAIFTDLGDGVVYGARNYVNADDNQIRTIDLNPAAINALTAKSGQAFALGGQLTTLDLISNTEYVFGFSNTFAPSDVQLILNLGAPPPVISVVASDASAAETLAGTTPNPGRFTLSRSGGATANSLSVSVSLGGTASNGADYLPIPTTVNFAAGALVADVDLIVVDDALVEGSETASLTILAGNGYAIGAAASATVTIQDNDSVPNTIILSAVDTGWYDQTGFHSPTNPNYIVGDYFNLYRNFFAFNLPTFTAPITGAQLAINTFDYDSPALNENYQVLEVTTPVQTLLAGGSGKTAIYADLGDGVAYGVRSYFNNDDNQVRIIDLNSAAVSALTAKSGQAFAFGGLLTSLDALSNSEYVFGFSNSVGPLDVRLILNTGAPLPSVSVVASDPSAAETLAGAPPNPGEFTLSRSGPLTSPLTVNLAMSGTATNGIDYGFLSGPITFAAGVASLPLSLSVIDDLLVEGTETATLNVLAGLGYSVGSAASATVSILDNDTVSSTTVVNAVDTGWYNKSGFHDPSNTNYIAGDSFDLYRNFFAFNLPVLTAPIISAQLAINTYDYNSANALETYQLQHVSTAVPNLTAGGSGLTAIYADLGDGITFGGRSYINADDYLIRTIDLNAAAINAITARSGQAFALGGQVTSLDTVSNFEYVFGFSNSVVPTDVRLILNTGTALPLVSVVATDAAAAETLTGASPNPGQFTLFRTGSTANALSVNVALGGTATNGADYNAITGPITFAAGAASVVVPLNVIDDLLVEGSETATLTVTAGNGYSLGAGSSATVTIEDNDGLNQLKTATLSSTPGQTDPIIDFRSAATTAATAADEVQPVPISDSLFEKIPLLTDNRLLIEKSAGKVYLNLDGSRANPTNLIDSLNKSLTPLPEYLFAT